VRSTVSQIRPIGGSRVAGIDLTIVRGVVFALLGPNGAGKTTMVDILERRRGEPHDGAGEAAGDCRAKDDGQPDRQCVSLRRGRPSLHRRPERSSAATRLAVTRKRGRYPYRCTVDSHSELGMKGVLRVRR
jgi:ABC-type uncharacterized transport system ATPase subunit